MAVTRRKLFQSLLGGGAAAIAGAPIATPGARPRYPTIEQPLDYQGFQLHWSGWKGSQEHRWLVGQWFAWRWAAPPKWPESVYYYLNVPGMIGSRYDPGASFNLTMPWPRRYVYPETSEQEKDHLVWLGCEHLRDLLRRERA